MFDVIAHGCNCHSVQGAGLAPQMVRAFGTDKFPMELVGSNMNKLGCIDFKPIKFNMSLNRIITNEELESGMSPSYFIINVVNAYTQYNYGKNHIDGSYRPLDYEALTLCMRKINHVFKGKHIGLPQIGAGLAGGNWELIKEIIQRELSDCNVTIVIYKPENINN
jgi:O-acetyl-ADP-ribose deacetylase (regulator of RNase III)